MRGRGRVFNFFIYLVEKSACGQVAGDEKNTSCAKAPMNRSASNATLAKEPCPTMLKDEKQIAFFASCFFPDLRMESMSIGAERMISFCLIM